MKERTPYRRKRKKHVHTVKTETNFIYYETQKTQ